MRVSKISKPYYDYAKSLLNLIKDYQRSLLSWDKKLLQSAKKHQENPSFETDRDIKRANCVINMYIEIIDHHANKFNKLMAEIDQYNKTPFTGG